MDFVEELLAALSWLYRLLDPSKDLHDLVPSGELIVIGLGHGQSSRVVRPVTSISRTEIEDPKLSGLSRMSVASRPSASRVAAVVVPRSGQRLIVLLDRNALQLIEEFKLSEVWSYDLSSVLVHASRSGNGSSKQSELVGFLLATKLEQSRIKVSELSHRFQGGEAPIQLPRRVTKLDCNLAANKTQVDRFEKLLNRCVGLLASHRRMPFGRIGNGDISGMDFGDFVRSD